MYDAAMRYAGEAPPWWSSVAVNMARGPVGIGQPREQLLLGVRAVIATSYERIHRSNLVGMGVLPLTFLDGEDATSLGLDGTEAFDIQTEDEIVTRCVDVTATFPSGRQTLFQANVRLDTPWRWATTATAASSRRCCGTWPPEVR